MRKVTSGAVLLWLAWTPGLAAGAHRPWHRAAHGHPHEASPPVSLLLPPSGRSLSAGALHLDRPVETRPSLQVAPSFFAAHAALVRHDLLLFQSDTTEVNRPTLVRDLRSEAPQAIFFSVGSTDDLLELARQRDHLLLFQPRQAIGGSLAVGLSLFASAALMSGHAPKPLRVLFDGPVHLGPAIFGVGGMGMGVGGRW